MLLALLFWIVYRTCASNVSTTTASATITTPVIAQDAPQHFHVLIRHSVFLLVYLSAISRDRWMRRIKTCQVGEWLWRQQLFGIWRCNQSISFILRMTNNCRGNTETLCLHQPFQVRASADFIPYYYVPWKGSSYRWQVSKFTTRNPPYLPLSRFFVRVGRSFPFDSMVTS